MKLTFIISFLMLASLDAQVNYSDYFTDKTLRFDFFQTGTSEEVYYSFDKCIEEPAWGGSTINLIDTIEYGNSFFKVIDVKSGRLIYSRGFSTLFKEWQTTDEAKNTARTFEETIVFPFPKDSVEIKIYHRDKKNKFVLNFSYFVDPKDYFISKERKSVFDKFKVHYSGNPQKKLDIVFIPEGYTKQDSVKFHSDCNRFKEYLFSYSPFNNHKSDINIWGIDAFSFEPGVDNPADSIWKKTLVDAAFYTFDSERYLMTTSNHKVRDVASNAPYDQIYILVNSDKYGGGSIYNYYSCTVVDNKYSRQVFIHEFGHGLAGLADEYYTSDVAYQNFYPKDVEPWEANITTLVNFDDKWNNLMEKGTPIPTPLTEKNDSTIGVFEGGGYAEKGVYRSTVNSIMNSFASDEFNEVSKIAIEKIIKFYAE